ncbi:hypothetical protein FVER53590_26480 [Fusarium verticillioides]|nr:hypothetical protein FVER53590_26480 [Fusarium verticillioides]
MPNCGRKLAALHADIAESNATKQSHHVGTALVLVAAARGPAPLIWLIKDIADDVQLPLLYHPPAREPLLLNRLTRLHMRWSPF